YVNRATAEVKIIKHTDPRGIDQAFTFTSNLAGGTIQCSQSTATSFSLNDSGNTNSDSNANTQDCTGVAPGSYAVTEGAEPNGWTFESLSCTASTGSSGSQDASNSAKANITLVAGGTVTCTYTNKQPTGAILITKTGKYKNCAKAGDPVKNAGNTQVGV